MSNEVKKKKNPAKIYFKNEIKSVFVALHGFILAMSPCFQISALTLMSTVLVLLLIEIMAETTKDTSCNKLQLSFHLKRCLPTITDVSSSKPRQRVSESCVTKTPFPLTHRTEKSRFEMKS